MEMRSVLESKVLKSNNSKPFIVHYLRSSMILESVPLQKATKICSKLPVLVVSYADNVVKARCCVPTTAKTRYFDAEKWLEKFASVFNSSVGPPKGQDGTLVCNMKAKRISLQDWDTLLAEGLESAKQYAKENL